MLRTRLILACCAAMVAAALVPAGAAGKTITQNTSATFGSNTPNTLPASGPATIYPWNVQVFGLLGKTTGVEVTLRGLTHERVSDLDALLVAPNGGRSTMFMSDVGDGTDILPPGVTVTFKDGANTNAPIGTPLTSGNFRPTNGVGTDADAFGPPAPTGPYGTALSRLKGDDPNGIWSLYLTDDDGDAVDPATGAVQGFAIKVSSRLKTKVAKVKKKRSCKRARSKVKRRLCRCKRIKSAKKRKKCKRKAKRRGR